MKTRLQLLKDRHCSKGFTLIELLLAMSITSIVLSLAGAGLLAIMEANEKSERENERRVNLNRAMDFIADEVRMANSVQQATAASGQTPFSTSGTGVLLLNIPSDTTNPNKVYFIRPSSTTWISPNTINRAEGTYTNPISSITANTDRVLVDAIETVQSVATGTCASGYRYLRHNTTSTWVCLPATSAPSTCSTTLTGNNGFFACVGSDNRTVDLYLYGKLSSNQQPSKQPYLVKTRVFARSS